MGGGQGCSSVQQDLDDLVVICVGGQDQWGDLKLHFISSGSPRRETGQLTSGVKVAVSEGIASQLLVKYKYLQICVGVRL